MDLHPSYGLSDARLTIFSKVIGIQRSMTMCWVFRRDHLTDPIWWQSLSYDIRWHIPIGSRQLDDVLSRYIDELAYFLITGFVHGLCSAIESSFRIYVRVLSTTACNSGNAEFISIYTWLIKRLGLPKYLCLLNLLRQMRNTYHNNGVYYHTGVAMQKGNDVGYNRPDVYIIDDRRRLIAYIIDSP